MTPLSPLGCDSGDNIHGGFDSVAARTSAYSMPYGNFECQSVSDSVLLDWCAQPPCCNTKGYSSTDLAMGFAHVRAGTPKRRGARGTFL